MKVTIADDRPALVPTLLTALFAGVVALVLSNLFAAVGFEVGQLSTLLAVAIGLLVGLFVRDAVAATVARLRG